MKTSFSEQNPGPRVDWDDILTIPHFYGRKEEYERLDITGIRGLNKAEIASLQALGAIDEAAL